MTKYIVLAISIILFFALAMMVSIIIAVIKGFRAGETVVEVSLIGIIQFSIRLSDIHARKHNVLQHREKKDGMIDQKNSCAGKEQKDSCNA